MFKSFSIAWLLVLSFCSLSLAKEEYPFTGLITSENINVRAGANINFEPLCKLVANERVVVVGKSYNWYKIVLPKDAVCFVSERYVAVEDSTGKIIANRVNVRAKPSEKAAIIGQLNSGEKVRILKKNAEWLGIEPTENCFGWVHEKFLRFYSAEVEKEAETSKAKCENSALPAAAVKPTEVKKQTSAEEVVSAVGIVEPMGRVFNRAGTHKLTVDGKIVYILSGDRAKLDSLVNYRVKVVGVISNKPSAKYPVIAVNQISACE